MCSSDIGLIGLGVMGRNLVLNMESKGFRVSVYNRTAGVTDQFVAGDASGKSIKPCKTIEELIKTLSPPRKIQIMVNAGVAVDDVIDRVIPFLEAGDIVIDGGNSLWTDTQRREHRLKNLGLHFFGMGISGGEAGALTGPSIMPGGPAEAWGAIEPIYTRIAAKVEGDPCCKYIGPGGAGHYVKMVHNGIEYGDMELICEAYAILRSVLGMNPKQLADTFKEWNKGDIDSYLIEITAKIFAFKDPETRRPLIDVIVDRAGQKGTGRWAVGSATEIAVPLSVIASAVESRILSAMRSERIEASKLLPGPNYKAYEGDQGALIHAVHDALYASKIISYSQGFCQLSTASRLYEWNLDLGAIASIWRGGCIIRARLLERIREAYREDPESKNLILTTYFRSVIESTQSNWRMVSKVAIEYGIAVPAIMAAISYYDSYRSARLPHNLLQAQRDYFGAHTYERVDHPEGKLFHTNWSESEPLLLWVKKRTGEEPKRITP